MDEKRPQLDTLTEADFTPRVGQTFQMQLNAAGERLDLSLTDVHTHRYAPPHQKRQGFSLTFRSSLPGAAPQAIYTLTHEDMGTMEVFIVPVGLRDGGMCYEVVFN